MTNAEGSMPTDGRWGWYKDHTGEQFQRVSTLIKKVETDDYHLRLWERRQVLVGAAARDDVVLGAKAMKPHPVTGWSDAQKRELNKLVEKAEEAAKETDGAVLGTAVHTLTERLDRGEDVESVVRGLPAQAERDLRAYAKLIELNDWRSVEIERTVINDELAVAGTFDRVYEIPGLSALLGPWVCQYGHTHEPLTHKSFVIGDVKTERSPEKNGLHIGPQLGTYSRARRMWLPSGEYVPATCVRQDVAVVVHVKDGHATPYFVDINAGWEAAQAARAQAEREKASKRWLAPMPGIKEPPPFEVAGATAVTQGYGTLTMPPVPEEVAVQVAPGVVAWQPIGEQGPELRSLPVDSTVHELPIGTQTVVGGVTFTKIDTVENSLARGALDDVDRQAIEAIWVAPDIDHLQRTVNIYTDLLDRTLAGRVQEAAAARWQQLTCVQRALHTGGPGAKCACGWVTGILP